MSTALFFTVSFLLTVMLVIGIHELGHFAAARLLGIRVSKFSIGFGPEIGSCTDRHNTRFVISAIPLGGFVSLADEHAPDGTHQQNLFEQQPWWKRFIVIAAGPVSNLVFALILYWCIFIIGFTSVLPVTGKITPDSIADRAGLKPDHIITAVDNTPVTGWMGVIIRILDHTGDHDQLKMQTTTQQGTHSKEHFLSLADWNPDPLKPDILSSLGMSPWMPKNTGKTAEFILPEWILHNNQYNPVEAFQHAWQNTRDFAHLNLKMLVGIVTGKISLKSLGGPITIFEQAGDALRNGAVSFMSFLAFLSIAIGVINFFPIPGLDGGHLLVQSLEAIFRRKCSPRLEALIGRLGLIVIILVAIQALANDLMRLA